jgi:hypothetical protein
MPATPCARRLTRTLAVAAPILLLLPAIALAAELSRRSEFVWYRGGHNVVEWQIPRALTALGAAWGALLLLFRRERVLGVALGTAAVVVASSSAFVGFRYGGMWWARFGAFGRGPLPSAAWAVATIAALACVPRTRRLAAAPKQTGMRRVAAWVPASFALLPAGALLSLAWTKVESMAPVNCPDPWLDVNLTMTTAEMWTGLLVLLPRTRRAGLRFGIVLMEGTAAFAAHQWTEGASSRGCGCFGGIDLPWSFHALFAAALAAVLAVAHFRELWIPAAAPGALVPRAVSRRGFPALLVRWRAIRRARRVSGARPMWAAPAAGLALVAIAAPVLDAVMSDGLAAAAGGSSVVGVRVAAEAAVGLGLFAVGMRLLRPRGRGATDEVVPRIAGFVRRLVARLASGPSRQWTFVSHRVCRQVRRPVRSER